MGGYAERSHSISVPKNTGIDGFLRTLRSILVLPRVQSINIDSTGAVRYTRYVHEEETDHPVAVDYEDLEPWGVIRNGDLEEVSIPISSASSVISYMLNKVTQEGLVPAAFAIGVNSALWAWHERTSGVRLTQKSGMLYGLPVYTDRQIPDTRLILCGAYVRGGLINCHRFIATSMSEPVSTPPQTLVEIL